MFTDIVASTERSSVLGDRAWQDVLADHHRIVRGSETRYRGREPKTLGDGPWKVLYQAPDKRRWG